MSRSEQFYHGSNSHLEEGDFLSPQRARNTHVYYTDNIDVASRYGTNVYKVNPASHGQDRRRDYGAHSEYMTRTGATVHSRLPDSDVKSAKAEARKNKGL